MPALRFLMAALAVLLAPGLVLGQGVGVSPDGRKGRIHEVKKGDTLWDITDRYLGTPWIWPSIWQENEDIENANLIYPGDLIWITEGEMRKLTPEEAEALMRGDAPAEPARPESEPERPSAVEVDPFAVLDGDRTAAERVLEYRGLDHAPFVTAEQLEASGAVLGSHRPHYWLSQEQGMIVSLGEGLAHVGDVFSVFRVRRRVLHPETREVVGYFIEIVGRSEIAEVHAESSIAKILLSYAEIEPGDRLIPYEEPETRFIYKQAAEGIEGMVLAQQPHRVYSADGDLVVLDRGSNDGLTSGNQFVVYRSGRLVRDPVTTVRLLEPDDIVGHLFVLRTHPRTSLALVMRSRREIEPGDRFRAP